MGWERASRRAWTAVVGAAFPGRCAGCGLVGAPVCAQCASALPPAAALPIPAALDDWIAPFAYVGVARELVARVKYRNDRAALPWLADAMVAALHERPSAIAPPTVVTWAPASTQRRRDRGFDHGELLARAIGRRIDRPTTRLLTRDAGPAQTGRSRAERLPGPRLRPLGSRARGGSILVVDDVLTTGATLAAAATALRAAGAVRVVAATAAATPPRPP